MRETCDRYRLLESKEKEDESSQTVAYIHCQQAGRVKAHNPETCINLHKPEKRQPYTRVL